MFRKMSLNLVLSGRVYRGSDLCAARDGEKKPELTIVIKAKDCRCVRFIAIPGA